MSFTSKLAMYVAHHWHAEGIFEFDPVSGSVVPAPAANPETAEWGAVWKEGDRWFVIWKDENSLVLQQGIERWPLTAGLRFRVTRNSPRVFEVLRDGACLLKVKYGFKGLLAQTIDPTYDEIDEDMDDFFLYVVGMWGFWKDRPISSFMQGK
jgi:hypothetical protein